MNNDPLLMLEKENDLEKLEESLMQKRSSEQQKLRKQKTHAVGRKNVDISLDMPNDEISQITDKTQDLEQLDKEIEDLSINIEAFGFPDCGNLRSTTRKDIKMRMRCLKAMLK